MDSDDKENEDVEIISTHDEKAKTVGEILSNDSSRKILNLLNGSNELTLNEISQKTGLSLSLATHHIKRMQSAEIVKISRIGRSVKGQKMNYYTSTNQSFLIVPSKEPETSIKPSLKKFSKFFSIGMAGVVSWITLNQGNTSTSSQKKITEEQNSNLVVNDKSVNEWSSASQTTSDEDKNDLAADSFTSGMESENEPVEQTAKPTSSESEPIPEPEPEPEPSHSGLEEFEFSEDKGEFEVVVETPQTLEDADRANTGSVSFDREIYPVPYSSEASSALDGDGMFLSIVIPIIVVVAGIILERILTRWYRKRKNKN